MGTESWFVYMYCFVTLKEIFALLVTYFQISVKVTQRFIDYISSQPIVFEVFGHFSNHPLHDESHDARP